MAGFAKLFSDSRTEILKQAREVFARLDRDEIDHVQTAHELIDLGFYEVNTIGRTGKIDGVTYTLADRPGDRGSAYTEEEWERQQEINRLIRETREDMAKPVWRLDEVLVGMMSAALVVAIALAVLVLS